MEQRYKGRFVLEADVKNYLDDLKREIKEDLSCFKTDIKELLDIKLDPVEKQQDKHTKDIDDLYNKDREMRDRIGAVEGRVKTLEDDKEHGKFSKEMKIVLVAAILSPFAGALISFVMGQ